MKRPIYFCKSWFRGKKRPTEVWTEEQSRVAHVKKQLYTVLIDSIEQPYCFLEITEKSVGVGFLDEYLRESLTYAFQEVELGKLFLTMAVYREFEGNTDKVNSGVVYIFEPSGEVTIKKESFYPEHVLETSHSQIDVSQNYADYPSFGDYDSLIQVERKLLAA